MKEKIKNILVKIKNNKKKVIGITVGVFLTFIFTFTVYNMNNPTKLNRLFASIGSVPNEAFEDSDFYNCIVDTYNNANGTSKAYTDSLTDEELASITNLTCTWKNIESAKGVEKLIKLEALDLYGNYELKNIDLSNNTNLSSLYIDGTSLIEDILIQNGETYTIEEKIIPPRGQNFSYSINDTSIASIQGNVITALQEGKTTLRMTFGNFSFTRNLTIGVVLDVPYNLSDYGIVTNEKEKYIYLKAFDSFSFNDDSKEGLKGLLRPNIGEAVIEDNLFKVVFDDKVISEYKIVYFNGGTKYDDSDDYNVVVSSTEEPTKYNIEAVNCTYEFINDGKEVIIKYNDNEIDRKKIVYMYLPNEYKCSNAVLIYFGNNILDSSIINNIDDISQMDKNKVNVLNAQMTYKNDDGNYFDIKDDDESVSYFYPFYINSNNYNLTKNYIYLGTNEFDSDLIFFDDSHTEDNDRIVSINNNRVNILQENDIYYGWDLIKVTSDEYDMSGDTIDLKETELDISKINVTNANLKVDNNKLLVMYNDEVVKEFKLENIKKPTTTTKPSSEEKTTTRVTTKENKTTTTKKTATKKKSIIDKIFGKSETTTKKEETTTKKSVIIKRTNKTTKVVDSSRSVTNNNKNSNNKIVTKSNILILLLSVVGIGLIVYIIINNKKDKEA